MATSPHSVSIDSFEAFYEEQKNKHASKLQKQNDISTVNTPRISIPNQSSVSGISIQTPGSYSHPNPLLKQDSLWSGSPKQTPRMVVVGITSSRHSSPKQERRVGSRHMSPKTANRIMLQTPPLMVQTSLPVSSLPSDLSRAKTATPSNSNPSNDSANAVLKSPNNSIPQVSTPGGSTLPKGILSRRSSSVSGFFNQNPNYQNFADFKSRAVPKTPVAGINSAEVPKSPSASTCNDATSASNFRNNMENLPCSSDIPNLVLPKSPLKPVDSLSISVEPPKFMSSLGNNTPDTFRINSSQPDISTHHEKIHQEIGSGEINQITSKLVSQQQSLENERILLARQKKEFAAKVEEHMIEYANKKTLLEHKYAEDSQTLEKQIREHKDAISLQEVSNKEFVSKMLEKEAKIDQLRKDLHAHETALTEKHLQKSNEYENWKREIKQNENFLKEKEAVFAQKTESFERFVEGMKSKMEEREKQIKLREDSVTETEKQLSNREIDISKAESERSLAIASLSSKNAQVSERALEVQHQAKLLKERELFLNSKLEEIHLQSSELEIKQTEILREVSENKIRADTNSKNEERILILESELKEKQNKYHFNLENLLQKENSLLQVDSKLSEKKSLLDVREHELTIKEEEIKTVLADHASKVHAWEVLCALNIEEQVVQARDLHDKRKALDSKSEYLDKLEIERKAEYDAWLQEKVAWQQTQKEELSQLEIRKNNDALNAKEIISKMELLRLDERKIAEDQKYLKETQLKSEVALKEATAREENYRTMQSQLDSDISNLALNRKNLSEDLVKLAIEQETLKNDTQNLNLEKIQLKDAELKLKINEEKIRSTMELLDSEQKEISFRESNVKTLDADLKKKSGELLLLESRVNEKLQIIELKEKEFESWELKLKIREEQQSKMFEVQAVEREKIFLEEQTNLQNQKSNFFDERKVLEDIKLQISQKEKELISKGEQIIAGEIKLSEERGKLLMENAKLEQDRMDLEKTKLLHDGQLTLRLAELSEREANIHNSFISLEKERKEQVRLEAEWTIQYDKLSVKQRDLSQEKEELDKRDKKLQEKEKWIKLQEKNLRKLNSDIVSPSNSSLSPNLIISPVKMNQSYMDLTTDLKKRIEELEAREAAVRKEDSNESKALLAQYQNKMNELEDEKRRFEQLKASRESDLNQQQARLISMEKHFTDNEHHFSDEKRKFYNEKHEFDEQVRKFKVESESTKARLETMQKELDLQVREFLSQKDSVEAELEKKLLYYEETLASDKQSLDKQREEQQRFAVEFDVKSQMLSEMERKLKEHERSVEISRSELINSTFNTSKSANLEIESIRNRELILIDKERRLNSSIEKFQIERENFEVLRKNFEQDRTALNKHMAELNSRVSLLDQWKQRVAQVQQYYANIDEYHRSAREQLMKSSEEVAKRQTEVVKAEIQLQASIKEFELRALQKTNFNTLENKKEDMNDFRSRIEELKEQLQNKNSLYLELKNDTEKKDAFIRNINSIANRCGIEISDFENRYNAIKNSENQLKVRSDLIERQHSDLDRYIQAQQDQPKDSVLMIRKAEKELNDKQELLNRREKEFNSKLLDFEKSQKRSQNFKPADLSIKHDESAKSSLSVDSVVLTPIKNSNNLSLSSIPSVLKSSPFNVNAPFKSPSSFEKYVFEQDMSTELNALADAIYSIINVAPNTVSRLETVIATNPSHVNFVSSSFVETLKSIQNDIEITKSILSATNASTVNSILTFLSNVTSQELQTIKTLSDRFQSSLRFVLGEFSKISSK